MGWINAASHAKFIINYALLSVKQRPSVAERGERTEYPPPVGIGCSIVWIVKQSSSTYHLRHESVALVVVHAILLLT